MHLPLHAVVPPPGHHTVLVMVALVLVVVVVAELMALVINLVATYYSDFSMGRLAITSLFVQWVGLTSAALVCQLRSRLNRLAPAWAAVAVVAAGASAPPVVPTCAITCV